MTKRRVDLLRRHVGDGGSLRAWALYPFATDTPAKTTNCRICQPFGGAYEQKAGREAIQGQAITTDRTRAVLSAISGMRIPRDPPSFIALGVPP